MRIVGTAWCSEGMSPAREGRSGVVTVAPGGGVNVNVAGSIASNETEVNPASTDASAAPLAKTWTRNGSRVSASIASVTRPIRVSGDRGVSTSSYAGLPATRAVPSTATPA